MIRQRSLVLLWLSSALVCGFYCPLAEAGGSTASPSSKAAGRSTASPSSTTAPWTVPLTVREYNKLHPRPQQSQKWRVMYGQKAQLGQFPFIVSLSSGCTGSILDANTVLTAAHCVCDNGPIEIVAGVLMHHFPTQSTQKRYSHTVYVNDQHLNTGLRQCMSSGPYDMAVIKVSQPWQFTAHVAPVSQVHCDPNNTPRRGSEIVNMGYGRSEEYLSGILKFGANTLHEPCASLDGYLCSRLHNQHGQMLNVVAQGDSGGPVVRPLRDAYGQPSGQFEQIGVNSGASDTMGYYAPTLLSCHWLSRFYQPRQS